MIGPRTREQVIASLESERRDLLNQLRRQVHTSRSDGIQGYINKIDRRIAKLTSAGATRKRQEGERMRKIENRNYDGWNPDNAAKVLAAVEQWSAGLIRRDELFKKFAEIENGGPITGAHA